MGQIPEAKLEIVRRLVEQAPDSAIRSLQLALVADDGHDPRLAPVKLMVESEARDRHARNLVFAPVVGLCVNPGPFSGLTFPPRTLSLIWAALKACVPSSVDEARGLAADWRPDGEVPADVFDDLCARAAAGLRDTDDADFKAVADAADAGGGREALAACLDIASATRRALDHLPEWLGRMTVEKAAKLRLAYRDVVAISEDGGPLFFEMLSSHLSEPWLILRIISGVMDRPNETYLAGSELGGFGARVLADIDRRLEELMAFSAAAGRQTAHAAAHSLHIATLEIAEFEQSVVIAPEGVWGRQLWRQKKTLATTIEAHLKATDGAVAKALPLQTVRLGPKTARGIPKLVADPDQAQVEKAATLLTFLNEVRPSASAGGFASARTKTLEDLEARLDAYVEDILDEIRSEHVETRDRARAYLEIAAEFCGLTRDDKAAQIVRRRAAAA